jgi:hypothetical protein
MSISTHVSPPVVVTAEHIAATQVLVLSVAAAAAAVLVEETDADHRARIGIALGALVTFGDSLTTHGAPRRHAMYPVLAQVDTLLAAARLPRAQGELLTALYGY